MYSVRYRAFSLAKPGNQHHENEDWYTISADEGIVRVVVTDGATESFHSGIWARELAQAFCNCDAYVRDGDAWIDGARRVFSSGEELTNLPWHAVLKAAQGSHATLGGVEFDLQHGTVTTVSIGDCCGLVCIGGETHVFPKSILEKKTFSTHPALVVSRADVITPIERASYVFGVSQSLSGVVMSDALAAGIFGFHRFDVARIRRDLDEFFDQASSAATLKSAFETGVHKRIRERELNSDDMTMVAFRIDKG